MKELSQDKQSLPDTAQNTLDPLIVSSGQQKLPSQPIEL